MEKADTIIAISQNTKDDILKFYPHISASKIEVVYLSHSIELEGAVSTIPGLPEKYILFVGSRIDYKNFTFFIEAIAPLLKSVPELYVVCAGGGKIKPPEKELLEQLNITPQIIQQDFEDRDLAAYYHHAQCFVFPSLYEGFGIPVLEAMECGCPVVLSAHSSFTEVAGAAGVYFEKNNANDLLEKVTSLIGGSLLKHKYIAAGYEQSKKFSWQKTIVECLDIYKKTIYEQK